MEPCELYLEDLLVLFGMGLLDLLCFGDVIFQVANSMLVCLESLEEQARCLAESSAQLQTLHRASIFTDIAGIGIRHGFIVRNRASGVSVRQRSSHFHGIQLRFSMRGFQQKMSAILSWVDFYDCYSVIYRRQMAYEELEAWQDQMIFASTWTIDNACNSAMTIRHCT